MASNVDKEKLDGSVNVAHSTSDSDSSYDEAVVTTGAPTEKISPLGYHVDWISVVFLVRPLGAGPFNIMLTVIFRTSVK